MTPTRNSPEYYRRFVEFVTELTGGHQLDLDTYQFNGHGTLHLRDRCPNVASITSTDIVPVPFERLGDDPATLCPGCLADGALHADQERSTLLEAFEILLAVDDATVLLSLDPVFFDITATLELRDRLTASRPGLRATLAATDARSQKLHELISRALNMGNTAAELLETHAYADESYLLAEILEESSLDKAGDTSTLLISIRADLGPRSALEHAAHDRWTVFEDDAHRVLAVPAWTMPWVLTTVSDSALDFGVGVPTEAPDPVALSLWAPRSNGPLASYAAAEAAAHACTTTR